MTKKSPAVGKALPTIPSTPRMTGANRPDRRTQAGGTKHRQRVHLAQDKFGREGGAPQRVGAIEPVGHQLTTDAGVLVPRAGPVAAQYLVHRLPEAGRVQGVEDDPPARLQESGQVPREVREIRDRVQAGEPGQCPVEALRLERQGLQLLGRGEARLQLQAPPLSIAPQLGEHASRDVERDDARTALGQEERVRTGAAAMSSR